MQNLIADITRSFAWPTFKRAAGVVTRHLPIPQPLLLAGPGASVRLAETLGAFGHRRLLLVTDATVMRLGLARPLQDALAASGVACEVFDESEADAPLPVIERGVARFRAASVDGLVAVGGGSVMDTAKVIGLAAANDRPARELAGYFRGRHGPVPIHAVPTTAGTGSEVTVAAVVSDPQENRKLVIADTRIVPRSAALDPLLMTGLPAEVTAATGLDALTHAVEAFIGHWNTPESDAMALAATALVFRWLPVACARPQDLAAREQMALAACFAGLAFTRANVGNVHALAHQLGGLYHVPHGLANAVLLAPVLRFYGEAARPRLAVLAVRAGVAAADEPEALRARRFIEAVEGLNRTVGLPATLEALREADVPALAEAACEEADQNYPVPRTMSTEDAASLLRGLLPAPVRRRRPPAPPAGRQRAAARAAR